MRTAALLFVLAAAVAASPNPVRRRRADADDSFAIGEVARDRHLRQGPPLAGLQFLADQDYDTFDFQEWYNEQLTSSRPTRTMSTTRTKMARTSRTTPMLQAALERHLQRLCASQGDDFADFVRDVVGEGIDHLNNQSQELLQHLQDTAQSSTPSRRRSTICTISSSTSPVPRWHGGRIGARRQTLGGSSPPHSLMIPYSGGFLLLIPPRAT